MPQRIARSSAITVTTALSIFSVDFSLSDLMFPAGSVRMKMLSIIHPRTGACRGLEIFLALPQVVKHMVTPDTQARRFFEYPEI